MTDLSDKIREQLANPAHVVFSDPDGRAAPYIQALETVLNLHQIDMRGFCAGCGWTYPCPTIRAIATAMGISHKGEQS